MTLYTLVASCLKGQVSDHVRIFIAPTMLTELFYPLQRELGTKSFYTVRQPMSRVAAVHMNKNMYMYVTVDL